jgi:PAS domain S-box-containing protein
MSPSDQPAPAPRGPGSPAGPAGEPSAGAYEEYLDPVLVVTPDGAVAGMNREAARVYGPPGDVVGRPLAALFADDCREQLDQLRERCLRGEAVRNAGCTRRDRAGGTRPVRLTLLRPDGGAGVVVIAHDVCELKEAEARLRRMTKVFLDAADPIRISDLHDGTTTDWNHEAERVFGWTREEVVGRPGRDLLAPEWYAITLEARKHLQRGEPVRNHQTTMVTKDGRRVPVLLTAFLLRDEHGEPIGVANIIKDVSDLTRLTTELENKNEELRQLTAGIAHDLLQPLNGVSGFAQVLAEGYRGRLDATADECLRYILDCAERMKLLIRGLLDYARLDASPPPAAPANCDAALDEALANLRPALEESGAVVTREPLPTVVGDAAQLMRLFQNLVGNAVKFRGHEPPRVHVAARRQGDEWVFEVRDNGIGIAANDLGRLFQVFARLHRPERYPGTGIGLAACKKIVERHGGRIGAESEPGRGSVFWFTLPAGGP